MDFPKMRVALRQKGKQYELTPLIDGVTWSGDYKQSARTLDFDLLYPNNDIYAVSKKVVPEVGDLVWFYVDDKEVFNGIVWTVDVTENNSFIQVNCYDYGIYLTKSTLAYNLKGVSPESTAKKVCEDLKLAQGNFEKTGITYDDAALGKSGYDMIMAGYTEAMKANNNKYLIRADGGRINVLKKGIVQVPIELDSKVNVFNAQFNETLDGMVNRVIMYDDTGAIVHEEQNQSWIDAYGILQSAVSLVEDETYTGDGVLADKEKAKRELKGTEKKCSVEGFGDIRAITGNAITLKVPHTKLVGLFYIDGDSHNWKNDTYTMNLTIAFENLMDEVDIDKEQTEDDGRGGNGELAVPNHADANKDWGHGITSGQLNNQFKDKLTGQGSLIIQLSNIYKVNPGLMGAIIMHETGNGSSKAIKEKNNPFGFMDSATGYSTIKKFNSLAEGLDAGISNLSRNYIYKGLKSIAQIQQKYAPNGVANDPNNLNQHWQSGVNKFFTNITGKTYSASMSGTGVGSKIDITFDSGGNVSGGSSGSGSSTGKFIWPMPGNSRISSKWGDRIHPITGQKKHHSGIDIAAPTGAKIVASDGGTVTRAAYSDSYGNVIYIKHSDGYETRYAHCSRLLVSRNAKVSKGQEIAKCGSTGNSTGPHLHFEIRQNDDDKNPSSYVKP